jgi:hypothetical protein
VLPFARARPRQPELAAAAMSLSEKLGNLDKSDVFLILLSMVFLALLVNLVLTIVFRHRDCNLEQPIVNIFNGESTTS